VKARAARSAVHCGGQGRDCQDSKQGHGTERTDGHSHHREKGDLGGLGITEEVGIIELLGREFIAMIEGRYTGQPST